MREGAVGFRHTVRIFALLDRIAAVVRSVQQLARKVPLGPSGVKVPHFNKSNVSAAWVAEGEAKPTTKGSLSLQYIQPHKIAAIIVDSAEVVRLNPGNHPMWRVTQHHMTYRRRSYGFDEADDERRHRDGNEEEGEADPVKRTVSPKE